MSADIEVSFDETSEEFKKLWENYIKWFDPYATHETFSENIASIVSRYGTNEFIEGVGYVNLNGEPQSFYGDEGYKEYPGVINIECDTDLNSRVMFETEYIIDQYGE